MVSQLAVASPESGQDNDDDKRSRGGSVAAAMSILRLLANREQSMGVNALARELGLAPSSCFKVLKTLVAEDFVEINPATKAYSLGNEAIAVARHALDPARAFSAIRSRLEETAEAYSIAIGLWRMLPKSRMALIGFAEGTNQMRIHMSIGQRLPMFVGAVGRANAACMNLSDEMLEANFRRLRWQVPLSFDEYRDQVKMARTLGYGYDSGNFSPGVNTVAVTILDDAGAIRYGLSGIMFNGQHTPDVVQQIAAELKQIAQWAEIRLVNRLRA